MPDNRFFIDQPLQKGATVYLKDSELHHLQVMKRGQKNHLELVNGRYQLAQAVLLELKRDAATLKIEDVIEKKAPHTCKIILAQALIKPAKLDFVLEKGTELGVNEFVFFAANLSELKELSENKKARFHSLIIAALKQCGRLDLPKITFLKNLKDCPQFFSTSPSSQNYFGDLAEKAPFLSDLPKKALAKLKNIAFFVGPEKGFTEEEIDFLKTNLKAKSTSLSQNILRAETAGITAAALLSYISRK